jgi:triphosphoribosyl-dephospho-CoA synthase
VTPDTASIAAAFAAACHDELDALKPGNVHRFADGHRMTVSDFVRSAEAAAEPLTRRGQGVGARINGAVEATFIAVGANTNLGIILLCAPLAAAAERGATDLRTALAAVLGALDREDAELAFRAIVRASPAGLGRSERHDVFASATVTLKQAMAAAAERDRIARQYATDFDDVFRLGEPALTSALHRMPHPRWATLAVYLTYLSSFPDTHIVRKHGIAAAEETRCAASDLRARLDRCGSPEPLLPDLRAWDAALKASGVNPGTSADLTVATLFAHRLRNILRQASRND